MEMGRKKKTVIKSLLSILLKLKMHHLLFTSLFTYTRISHLRIRIESEEMVFLRVRLSGLKQVMKLHFQSLQPTEKSNGKNIIFQN